MTVRVVVADDQEMIRTALAMVLDAQPDIEVVGHAGTGGVAIEETSRRRPDVVLMDVRMPGMDGIEATRKIKQVHGESVHVVILTTFDADQYVYDALASGASGFLLKDGPAPDLLRAVRAAADGDSLLSPRLTRRLIERYARRSTGPELSARIDELTPREFEVLQLIARGLSNREIAQRLILGEETVKTHVSRVFMKLGVRDRAQAVVFAYESGVVAPGHQP